MRISFAERAPFHSLASQSSITLTLIYIYIYIFIYFPALSEFPLETRQLLQFETWLLRGVNPHQTPRMLFPAKRSKSGGGSPGSRAPGSGSAWVHQIA